MMPVECDWEAEVLAAVLQGRWPGRVDPNVCAHVASCQICSDVAAIAGVIEDTRAQMNEEMNANAVVPNSGRVWWLAQLRARREAAEAANRPIIAVQIVAVVCAICLLGVFIRAASAWFSPVFTRIASGLLEHAVLALAMAAVLFLVPAGVYLALGRD